MKFSDLITLLPVLAALLVSGCSTPQDNPASATSENATLRIPAKIHEVSELDVLPKLVGIQAAPVYPLEMKRQGKSGKVIILFVVDTNGSPRNLVAMESTNAAFEEPALAAVKQWRFIPGQKNGKPVYCIMKIPISFNLTDNKK